MSIFETGEVLDALDARRRAGVLIAKAEIGSQTRDSDQVRKYMARVMPQFSEAQIRQMSKSPKFQWCGVFALWALHEANITSIPWQLGRGFVYRLPRVAHPEPCDIFAGPGPIWHHGIVESWRSVNGVPWLTSIEGNTPDVRRRDRPEPPRLTYYSILPFLKQALGLMQ